VDCNVCRELDPMLTVGTGDFFVWDGHVEHNVGNVSLLDVVADETSQSVFLPVGTIESPTYIAVLQSLRLELMLDEISATNFSMLFQQAPLCVGNVDRWNLEGSYLGPVFSTRFEHSLPNNMFLDIVTYRAKFGPSWTLPFRRDALTEYRLTVESQRDAQHPNAPHGYIEITYGVTCT
jgi:hypothetical protein